MKVRLIAGFEQPTSSEVLLDGAVVNEQKPYQRNVSTVFQNYALFPHLTAAENIAFGLKRKANTKDLRILCYLRLSAFIGGPLCLFPESAVIRRTVSGRTCNLSRANNVPWLEIPDVVDDSEAVQLDRKST